MWCLSRDDLESELRDNPDFAVGLLRKLAEEMRGQSKARIVVDIIKVRVQEPDFYGEFIFIFCIERRQALSGA